MSAEAMTMSTPMSRYDRRVKLVHDIVRAHSALDDKTAFEIAVNILHALDTVPEKVR